MTRVLVVDDVPELAEMMCRSLRLEGFDATSVNSITDARSAIETYEPHVAILDMVLPDGSGMELAAEVRATIDRPIGLIGYTGDSARPQLGGPLDVFLRKPAGIGQILTAIDTALTQQGIASRGADKS